jgi:small GTP-binding protein
MNTLKIVAVGDGAVGKTSMLISYSTNSFQHDYVPTVFDNYAVNVLADGKVYNVSMWDTAGQEDYDKIRPLSYPQSDVFLVCYSIINPASFANIKSKWMPELFQHAPETPKILVGLKNDMRGDSLIKKFVDESEADKLAKENNFVGHYLCSALTQDGLKNMFDKAVEVSIKKQKNEGKISSGGNCCVVM